MGVTFDTGALIGLQRRTPRMRAVWSRLQDRRILVTVPTVVLAECWQNPTSADRDIVALCEVEELSVQLAEVAARARSACGSSVSVVDAVVMASAASRGDDVYTADYVDLAKLRDAYFPGLRLHSVSGPTDA